MISPAEAGLTQTEYDAIKSPGSGSSGFRVEAHNLTAGWTLIQTMVGTGNFNGTHGGGNLFVGGVNTLRSCNTATGVWTTRVAPFTGETRYIHDANGLHAFSIVSNTVGYRRSTDSGATWTTAVTAAPTVAGRTITAMAPVSATRFHYISRNNTNRLNEFRVATFAVSWSNTGQMLYYPYPIDDMDACLSPSGDDLIVVETEVPGPQSADNIDLDNIAERYWEQKTAVISFTYKVAALDWGYHSEVDTAHRLNNPDDVTGCRVSLINGQLFATTRRTRGVPGAIINNATEYQSWDGVVWSIGTAFPSSQITSASEMFLVGTDLYAVGRDGKVFKAPATLMYGVSNPAVRQDVSADIVQMGINRAEMISAEITLANVGGKYDNHAIVKKDERVAFRIWAKFDAKEVLLGTVFADSMSFSEGLPARTVTLSCRDVMAWMTDYYKAEDFKQFDPESRRVLIRTERDFDSKTVFSTSTDKGSLIGGLPPGIYDVFAIELIGSRCFPGVVFSVPQGLYTGVMISSPGRGVFGTGYTSPFEIYYAGTRGASSGVPIGGANSPIGQKYDFSSTFSPSAAAGFGITTVDGGSESLFKERVRAKPTYFTNRGGIVNLSNHARIYAAVARLKATDLALPSAIDVSYGQITDGNSFTLTRAAFHETNPVTIPGFSEISRNVPIPDNSLWDAAGNAKSPTPPQEMSIVFDLVQGDYDWVKIEQFGNAGYRETSSDATHTYYIALEVAIQYARFILDDGSASEFLRGESLDIVQVGTDLRKDYYFRRPTSLASRIRKIEISVTWNSYKEKHNLVTNVYSNNGANPTYIFNYKLKSLWLAKDVARTGMRAMRVSNALQSMDFVNQAIPAGLSGGVFLVYRKAGVISACIQIYNYSFGIGGASIIYSEGLYWGSVGGITVRSFLNNWKLGVVSAGIDILLPREDTYDEVILYYPPTMTAPTLTAETLPANIYSDISYIQEYVTLDPGEAPMGGLQRAIDGRYIKLFTRYDGTLIPYQWLDKPSIHTFVDAFSADYAFDQRELHSHVRMLGAYTEAEFISDDLVSKIGHRFTEANNPYLLSEIECFAEAKNQVRRMKEESERLDITTVANVFIEPEDRITVTGYGDWIVNGYSLEFRPGTIIGSYSLRKWVPSV